MANLADLSSRFRSVVVSEPLTSNRMFVAAARASEVTAGAE